MESTRGNALKKSVRVMAALAIATSAALALTACDPPMPPDVAAQIAEQTYTCVNGDVTISSPAELADPISQWQLAVPQACVSPLPAMTLTPVTTDAADLLVSATPPTTCKPFATVPLAVESANIVFNLSVTSTLNLTPKTAAAILNGEIRTWSDSRIAKENVGTELPDEPIILNPKANREAFGSLNGWLTRLGAPLTASKIAKSDQAKVSDYAALAEGEVAIVPGSYALFLGLYSASLSFGEDSDKQPILANADTGGVSSAATQWVPKASQSGVTVSLDPGLAPIVPAGFDTAATPYQAIYPVNLYLCGEDTLLKRALANFILRLDSQGSLGASNFNQLSEATRTLALVTVRKGLPTPTAPATN
ncbi:MAG: hypothetical protein F2854_04830 [Actinobacteria bacterium]|nr:hypothetical protein [Actinomycetota bacterium]